MSQQAFLDAVARIKADSGSYLPETVLTVFICILLLHDVLSKRANSRSAAVLALIGIVCTGVAIAVQVIPVGGRELFAVDASGHGMVRLDHFGQFFKWFALAGAAVCVPMTLSLPSANNRRMGEFYALLLGAVFGMFVMASATNLLMVFLGIEFASLASYLLSGFVKRDLKGSEAGMKYVIYGSVASGVMVFGISLLYGMTGGLHLSAIAGTLLAGGVTNVTMLVASVMVFAGFAYKMAAFPLHFWCPDVYEGAPTPFVAFLSVTSKAAGFAVMMRFLLAFKPEFAVAIGGGSVTADWKSLIAVAALASMTVGNVSALAQTNVKRMLAYSSVAQAGYLLMGVAVLSPGSGWAQVQPVLTYFIAYFLMNIGAFHVVTVVEARLGTTSVEGYNGLAKRAPWLALCLTVFLFSLVGIPPTGGFSGKFQLFSIAIEKGMYWLAIGAGINTAISAYYYFRLLKAMYFTESAGGAAVPVTMGQKAMSGVLAASTLYLFFDFGRAVAFANGFAS